MKSNFLLRFFPRIQDIFFISVFAAGLLVGQQMLNLDGDLPRHLLTGKYIFENKIIPTTELFIYPYLNQNSVSHTSEWLSDTIFYVINLHTGLGGLVAASSILLACTFTILYKNLSTRLGLRIPVLVIVAWGAVATSINWAIRPHVISMFLLTIWLIWVEDLYRGPKAQILKFPIFMIVWANLHGEFIAGILVLLAYFAGWAINFAIDRKSTSLSTGKNIGLVFVLSTLASFINPGGAGPWTGILGFVNNQYLMSRMVEANTPNFQMTEMKIFLSLLVLSIFLLAIKRERLSAAQGLLLAGFSAMGLMAVRNIHLYGIVAPFVLAETLVESKVFISLSKLEFTLEKIEDKIKGAFWPTIIVLILSTYTTTNVDARNFYRFTSPMFPTQAVDWLENNPQEGRMFNDLNWGGYIAWKLWPNQLTFIDSMADVTGEVTMEYETAITLSKNWEDIFTRHNIEWAVLPADSMLARELLHAKGWHTIYQDNAAIILHK